MNIEEKEYIFEIPQKFIFLFILRIFLNQTFLHNIKSDTYTSQQLLLEVCFLSVYTSIIKIQSKHEISSYRMILFIDFFPNIFY